MNWELSKFQVTYWWRIFFQTVGPHENKQHYFSCSSIVSPFTHRRVKNVNYQRCAILWIDVKTKTRLLSLLLRFFEFFWRIEVIYPKRLFEHADDRRVSGIIPWLITWNHTSLVLRTAQPWFAPLFLIPASPCEFPRFRHWVSNSFLSHVG
jgi:hypothetical protein